MALMTRAGTCPQRAEGGREGELCAHALRAPRLANFWGSSKRLILRSKGDLARDVLPDMLFLGGDDPSVSTAHRRGSGVRRAPHTRPGPLSCSSDDPRAH